MLPRSTEITERASKGWLDLVLFKVVVVRVSPHVGSIDSYRLRTAFREEPTSARFARNESRQRLQGSPPRGLLCTIAKTGTTASARPRHSRGRAQRCTMRAWSKRGMAHTGLCTFGLDHCQGHSALLAAQREARLETGGALRLSTELFAFNVGNKKKKKTMTSNDNC